MPALTLQETDEYIRRQAYYFWEADGRPTGRDLEYWDRARVGYHAIGQVGAILPSTNGRYEGGISAQPPVL